MNLIILTSLLNYTVSSLLFLQARDEQTQAQRTLSQVGLWLLILATLLSNTMLLKTPYANEFSIVFFCLASWFTVLIKHFFSYPLLNKILSLSLTFFFFHTIFIRYFYLIFETTNLLWLPLHLASALMGQVLALFASFTGFIFLWQRNQLKKKTSFGMEKNLPALETLEKILLVCLWTGFIFLTIALISGTFWSSKTIGFNHLGEELPKIIWSCLIWLWYLSCLLGREIFMISTKQTAKMSLLGAFFLAMMSFGLSFSKVGGV